MLSRQEKKWVLADTPIVLIPGFMLTRDLWLDVLPGLALLGPQLHYDSGDGESIELQQGIPAAELVVLDAGHMVPLESPTELTAALLAFLKRLPQR